MIRTINKRTKDGIKQQKTMGELLLENKKLKALLAKARTEYIKEHSEFDIDCVTPYDWY